MDINPALFLGTRKGFWIAHTDRARKSWSISEPHFLGHIVQHAVLDPRDGRTLLLAMRTGHLGPTVFRSTDFGATWSEATSPPAFATGDPLGRSLNAVFWLTPGHADEPGVWYAGGSPQGLFRTEDGGDTWEPVSGWNDHPNFETWAEWPEQGTPDGSMLHSINVDPRDASHLYIGLSGGGVFESTDGGKDWAPLNRGSLALFMPEPSPEFGQDPHCVRLHPQSPDRLYQQNHCGIYRIDRPADEWVRVGENMPTDVGDIGFPIELHPRDPDTAWVFPMDGSDVWPRTSPGGKPAAFVTRDAGESWTRLDNGLPPTAWYTVKRQAMTTDDGDPVGVYFGTTSGELWASADEGESWQCVAQHLPEIYSVEYGAIAR
ncbi:MAG TPA: glycosyl hydrolase [Acidimicrobiia bacterium]|nr:glycosyl hydrolase [Acidimicrobiia bacterium]